MEQMKFFRSTEHLKDEENKSLNWSVLRKVLKKCANNYKNEYK